MNVYDGGERVRGSTLHYWCYGTYGMRSAEFSERKTPVGDIILFFAVHPGCYILLLGKLLVKRFGAFETTFIVMIFGALMYFPFGLVSNVTTDTSGVGISAWPGVIYMGIITM